MKTLIVGTGIIGTIYGWALDEAGVEVTHFVRKGRAARYQEPVRLDVLDERKGHQPNNLTSYAMRCVEEVRPGDGYELVIVPTNVYQTEDALCALAPVCGDAIFLALSANWEGCEFIDRLLPRDRYLMGYPDGGGTIRDGAYWTNLGAEIHLGKVDESQTGLLTRVSEMFLQADMKPDIAENVVHWLWVHNAGATGFAAGFARRRDMNAYLGDRALLRECVLSTREMYELCRLRGVDLKAYPEVGFITKTPVWLVMALMTWNFRHNPSMQRYTAHAGSDGSLRETAVNHAAMLQTARDLGFEMPYTAAMAAYLPPLD